MITLKGSFTQPSRGTQPVGGIAAAVLLDNAKEQALQRWERDMRAMQEIAGRMEAALVVALDPSTPPGKRNEALGVAQGYQTHLADAWDEARDYGRSDALRAFRDMATGLAPAAIATIALGLEAELRPPPSIVDLTKRLEEAKEIVLMASASLEEEFEVRRHPTPVPAPSF